MFSLEEKVVCIWQFIVREEPAEMGEVNPIKGEIYTIRTIEEVDGGIYLRFYELVNPVIPYANGEFECQYLSIRFRKLDYAHTERILAEITELASRDNLLMLWK